jgi:hypothetical protein
VRSQIWKETIRNVPTEIQNIKPENCPSNRTERVDESVYQQPRSQMIGKEKPRRKMRSGQQMLS